MISEQETLCNNNQELLQVPITHNNDNIEKDMNMAEIENENMPLNLPFDVSNDLKMFSKVFIVKIKDPFRAHHNCEPKKMNIQFLENYQTETKRFFLQLGNTLNAVIVVVIVF